MHKNYFCIQILLTKVGQKAKDVKDDQQFMAGFHTCIIQFILRKNLKIQVCIEIYYLT
jgi:hypothetical protein